MSCNKMYIFSICFIFVLILQIGFSLSAAVTFLDTPCPPGRYCPQGTTHGDENLCPARSFYNVTGAKALTDCLPCTPGMYCDVNGLTTPTALCDPGQCRKASFLFFQTIWSSITKLFGIMKNLQDLSQLQVKQQCLQLSQSIYPKNN